MQQAQSTENLAQIHEEVIILIAMLSVPIAFKAAPKMITKSFGIVCFFIKPQIRRSLKQHISNILGSITHSAITRLAPTTIAQPIKLFIDRLIPYAAEYLTIPASGLLIYTANQIIDYYSAEKEVDLKLQDVTPVTSKSNLVNLNTGDDSVIPFILCAIPIIFLMQYVASQQSRPYVRNNQSFTEQNTSNQSHTDQQDQEALYRQHTARQEAERVRQQQARQDAEAQARRDAESSQATEAARKAAEDAEIARQAAQAARQADFFRNRG